MICPFRTSFSLVLDEELRIRQFGLMSIRPGLLCAKSRGPLVRSSRVYLRR